MNNFRKKKQQIPRTIAFEEEHLADVPLQETEATSASQLFLAAEVIHANYIQFHTTACAYRYTFCLTSETNMNSYEFSNVAYAVHTIGKEILRSAFLKSHVGFHIVDTKYFGVNALNNIFLIHLFFYDLLFACNQVFTYSGMCYCSCFYKIYKFLITRLCYKHKYMFANMTCAKVYLPNNYYTAIISNKIIEIFI